MTNLATYLDETARRHPGRTAVTSGGRSWSYSELRGEADRVAGYLSGLGLRPGDAVALSCPNIAEFTAVYFGILKAGGVVVPLNILLRPREIAYHLQDSGARWHFAYRGTEQLPIADLARQAGVDGVTVIEFAQGDHAPWAHVAPHFRTADVDPDDVAVLIYTSGTSGQPKGAELRHRNLRDNAAVCAGIYQVTGEPADTFLCTLPLFHIFGQSCMQNVAIAFGGRIVMLERFDAREVLRHMAEDGVTVFGGVPTMYWALLNDIDDARAAGVDVDRIAGSLRVAASGGAAMQAEMHARFRDAFGVAVLDGYGLSETSSAVASARLGEPVRVGSAGRALPGVDIRLLGSAGNELSAPPSGELSDIGEIEVRGHGVMRGYRGRPEATSEAVRDGWLRTGDLGRLDADGFLYVVDRVKDLIIRGGFNVYPRELEEVLMTHPDVSLVAVVGVPHETHGEEIKAVVVRRPDSDLSKDRLREWAVEQFAAYKYPRIIEFRDALPMTASGKILKRDIV